MNFKISAIKRNMHLLQNCQVMCFILLITT